MVRAACQYALEHHLPSVTLVHKGNIMKFTEGGFKKWGYELAECEFGKELAEGVWSSRTALPMHSCRTRSYTPKNIP